MRSAPVSRCSKSSRTPTSYRFYDYGRDRELHLDEAVAAADTESSPDRLIEQPLGSGRSLLVSGPKFTVERWCAGGGRLRASEEAPLGS